MTKKTTNLSGILITILAGTYFTLMYCTPCNAVGNDNIVSATVSETTRYLNSGARVPGMAIILTGRLLATQINSRDGDSVHTFTNQP